MGQEAGIITTEQLAKRVAHECLCEYCQEVVSRDIKGRIIKLVKQEVESGADEKKKKHDEFFGALFKAIAPYERKIKAMIEGIWKEEQAIILANLKKMKKAWMTKDKIDQVLYPVAVFEKKLANGTTQIFIELMDAEGQRTMALYDLDVIFDVDNPKVQAWLKSYVPKFSKQLEVVNVEKLRAQLSEGIRAGESIRELAKRVSETYANWNKYRSENIARSETIRASNAAAKHAYLQSGVVKKIIWITQKDDRTCFPKNTKIITNRGEKNIQDIKENDIVLSHLGWQKVKKIMNRKYFGNLIKIKTSDGQKLIATKDHPIYEINKGWIEIRNLTKGSKLKTSENQIIDVIDILNIKRFNSYHFISKFFKLFISSNIFQWIRMPIFTINLKANIIFRNKKINFKRINFVFLNKINFQFLKSFFNNRFNRCFSTIFSSTRKRAKSSIIFSTRTYSKFFSTIQTFNINRWSSAFFRTMINIFSFGSKRFSTPQTNFMKSKFSPAFITTNSISISQRPKNRKGLFTNRTNFYNLLCFFSANQRTIFLKNPSSPYIKRIPALKTDFNFACFSRFMIAIIRTIKTFSRTFRNKFFSALFTYIHGLLRYVNKLIKISQANYVYNLEVENAHTYYANGILVHNCPWCFEMDGEVIDIEDNFFNLGDTYTVEDEEGKKQSMNIDYTACEYPPLHSQCYDDKTEVLTEMGWKYFKDLKGTEFCLSLNPNDFQTEYVPIKNTISYPYQGNMVFFESYNLLVTPNHAMVEINQEGKVIFKEAQKIKEPSVNYNGIVYCVELEKNHTLYVRRGEKEVWCGNCRCAVGPMIEE